MDQKRHFSRYTKYNTVPETFLLTFNIFSKSLETFHTYYGQDLEGKTLKTRRHIDTLYFLSNKVELDPKSNYGFNCTYLFI